MNPLWTKQIPKQRGSYWVVWRHVKPPRPGRIWIEGSHEKYLTKIVEVFGEDGCELVLGLDSCAIPVDDASPKNDVLWEWGMDVWWWPIPLTPPADPPTYGET